MARNIVYHMSEAYNIGYDDGVKDAIEKAIEFWKFEMKTSCPDDVYESWCQHKLEDFEREIKKLI